MFELCIKQSHAKDLKGNLTVPVSEIKRARLSYGCFALPMRKKGVVAIESSSCMQGLFA